MNRNIIISLALVFSISFITAAQVEKDIKKIVKEQLKLGDELYDEFDFHDAADAYEKVIAVAPDNYYAHYRYAECNRITRYYLKALKSYEIVSNNANSLKEYPLAGFWLGKMLRATGQYEKAIPVLTNFKKNYDEYHLYRILAENEIRGCREAVELMEEARSIKVNNLGKNVNRLYTDDFSPMMVDNDHLYITGVDTLIEIIDFKPDTNQVNRIYASKINNGSPEPRVLFNLIPDVPSKHIGNSSFSSDKQRIFYTMCEDTKDGRLCNIYYSQKKENGEWGKPQSLPRKINNPSFTSKHPVLLKPSETSKEYLFFCSDIDGGKGGFDIWYCTIDDKNNVSDPINLGEPINTQWDEVSPFYDVNTSTLFFSSNGHPGLGEFDLFAIRGNLIANTWERVINLGYPINTSTDDYYLTLSPDGQTAYLASNRAIKENDNLTCCDDIYQFKVAKETFQLIAKSQLATITGKLSDINYNGLSKAKIYLLDDYRRKIDSTYTNSKGKFKFKNLDPEKGHLIMVAVDEKNMVSDILLTDYKKTILKKTIEESGKIFRFEELPVERQGIYLLDFEDADMVTEEGKISIAGKVVDKNDPVESIENLKVFLHSKSDKAIDSTTTNQAGKFEFSNLPKDNDYYVRLDDHIKELLAEMLVFNDKGKAIMSAKYDGKKHMYGFQKLPLMQSSTSLLYEDDVMMIEEKEYVNITGVILQEDIMETVIYLLNSKKEIIDSTTTDILGFYGFYKLPKEETYSIKVKNSNLDIRADIYLTDQNGNIVQRSYKQPGNTFEFKKLNHEINDITLIDIEDPSWFNNEGEASIVGKIVEKDNPAKGIERMPVFLYDKPLNLLDSTLTDKYGNFKFQNLKENEDYIVKLEKLKKAFGDDGYLDDLDSYIQDIMAEMMMINSKNEIMKTSSSTKQDNDSIYTFEALPQNFKTKHFVIAKATVGEAFTLNNILFETGKFALLPESYTELNKLIKQLKDNPKVSIEIAGHTDNVGTEDLNVALSNDRAKAVKDYIIKNGINTTRLTSKGYGSSKPVAKNNTEDGRAMNRRVEIVIKGK